MFDLTKRKGEEEREKYKIPQTASPSPILSPGPRISSSSSFKSRPMKATPQPPEQNSSPAIGENLFLTNVFPIKQDDNPIIKGLKGAGNVALSVLSAPGELLRKASIQGGNVLSGKGLQELPKNTSFTQNILPKGASTGLNQFQQKNPFLGGLAHMALETAVDPTMYIGGGTIKRLATPESELGMAKLNFTAAEKEFKGLTPTSQYAKRKTEFGPMQIKNDAALNTENIYRGVARNIGTNWDSLNSAQKDIVRKATKGMPPEPIQSQKKLLPAGQDFTFRDVTTADRLRQMGVNSDLPLLGPGKAQPTPMRLALQPAQEFTMDAPYIAKTQIPKTEFERASSYPQSNFSYSKPIKSFKKSTDIQNNVDELSAQLDNQLKGMEKMIKQADEQTRKGTIRKAIFDKGGIKQGNADIFEEQRVIPNWIRNNTTGRPLDEVADELGMTSDDLLNAINDSKFVPKDYAKEAQLMANKDPEYLANSKLLDGLMAELPGKRTLNAIPKLKPRGDAPKPIESIEYRSNPIDTPQPTSRLSLNPGQNFVLQGEPYRAGIKVPKTDFDITPIQPSGFKTQIPKTEFDRTPIPPSGFKQTIEKPRIYDNSSQGLPPKLLGLRNAVDEANTRFNAPLRSRSEIPKVGNSIEPLQNRSVAAAIEGPTLTLKPPTKDVKPIQPQGNPKVVGAKPEIPKGLKERGVSENIRTDANRPDALRDSYSVNPLVYKQLGNKETLEKAQTIFDGGLEPAITQLDDLLKNMKPEAAPLVKMIADKLTLEGNIVRARELMSNAATKATESGQFGQAFRILRDADPETFLMTFDKQLKKLNKEGLVEYGKKWKDFDLTPDELAMVGKIERGNQASYDAAFEQIGARIANEIPATAMEKINAWRHISMLLNVKTNVRNVVGNSILLGMRKAAQKASGAIQKAFLKEADRSQTVSISKEYKELATKHFEANKKDLLGGSNKFQENIKLNMPDKRVFRKSRIGQKLGMDIDILEKTRKFNYELLKRGDNPFFQNAYVDRLASYAQSKGIKDFTQLKQEAFDIARLEAEQATYKDASIIADFINKAKRPAKDTNIARKGGALLVEAALPFTKTPINVIKRGIQYSPIGVANGLGMINSPKGAAAAIDELAKGLTGTGVLGLGYLLASKGILTGKASRDADLRSYDSSTGNSPFSILGKYSFDWAQPLSVPLAVGVEIYNAVKDNPEDKAKMDDVVTSNNTQKLGQFAAGASEAIVDGLSASGDTVFNMSIMRGVKLLFGSQQGVMEGLAQLPQGYATQFIPALSGQLAGSVDPLVRQSYVKGDRPASFKNAMVSRIPIASKTLQPRQTPFGEDMKKIENPAIRAFSQFLSPGIMSQNQNIDPKIDSELRRLNEAEGLKTQFPTVVPNYIEKTQSHPRITLTSTEATQYQKRVGELTLNSFQKLINSNSYINSKKVKLKSPDEVKADKLAEAIADAKALAKKEILKSKGLK